MGEEEKKPEEQKKAEEDKKEVKQAEKPEESKDGKDGKESKEQTPPPPPPPQEIILKVFMHCEGCARKVRRSLKGFEGVEHVITDCRTHKVVVKGEKADPLKVLERVQRKSHRQVELLSPIPKPPAPEEKKPVEEGKAKPEEKKEEPQIIMVVLKVHMHCEACALEIKKRIVRMKGVESAEPDLKNSQVSVKGVFDPPTLVEYVYKRTGKHAVIVKQEPKKKEKAEEGKGGDKKEKNPEESGGDKEKKDGDSGEGGGGDNNKEKKEGGGGGGGDEAKPAEAVTEENNVVEVKRNEYHYYPPRYTVEMYPYPPQIFSDENPNACSVM